MQIVRVYTGTDGESHFEDLTPEQFAKIVNNLGDGPITLNCRPSPLLLGLSPGPPAAVCRQSVRPGGI